MTEPPGRAQVDVWMSLAEQFLDTETRPAIPETALLCVEAGYGVRELRQAWLHEVRPAVGRNLLSPAGEWAAWDEAWLVQRIRQVSARGVVVRLVRRLRSALPFCDPVRVAIERCMAALLDRPVEDRRALTRDLRALASWYFDFSLERPGAQDAGRLAPIYAELFLPIFEPLVVRGAGESRRECAARVEAVLGVKR